MPLRSGALDNGILKGKSASSLLSNKVDPTLVLDLPFSEGIGDTAHDRSLYGNHATVYGASWVDGKAGKALSFDGIDNYMEAPFPIQLLGDQPFTIEMWLNLASDYLSSAEHIMLLGSPSTAQGYWWRIDMRPPYAQRLQRNFVNLSPGGLSPVLDLGQWYHIVDVYDLSTSKEYVNGQLRSTIGGFDATPNLTGFLDIAKGPVLGWQRWRGTADEVHIYNRDLTPAEILLHYDEGK